MIALKRVVLTGAGGFIGTAVCRALIRHGVAIRALVGAPGEQLEAPPGIAVDLRADIRDRAALMALMEGGVDVVIHLAGPPSVRASFEDPPAYADAHTGGTAVLLDACRRMGVTRFVYVSSAEVYGRPRTDPVNESHPLEARSPYAAAKIGAEQMVRSFGYAYGLRGTILRPFSVYGPGMGRHALLPAILGQLAAAGPMRLADLRPERDYCHVEDVARAIVAAARTERDDMVAINVGSGIGTSVYELARIALQFAEVNKAIEEDRTARRPGSTEILRLVADRQRAADVLDWRPSISLDAGIHDMLFTRAGSN